MFSTKKVIFAGNVLHLYSYSKAQKYGEPQTKYYTDKVRESNSDEDSDPTDSNAYRCKASIRRLLEANAWQYKKSDQTQKCFRPIFITFTFATDILTLSQSNPLFKTFIQRLNYSVYGTKCAKLKYLSVPEFQPVSGRVHYHVVFFNLAFQPKIYDLMLSVWGNGFTNIESVKTLRHLTTYVAKYITKEKRDERTTGKKKYFCSKDLFKPQIFRDERQVDLLIQQIKEPCSYEHDYNNYEQQLITNYKCFRLAQSTRQQYLMILQQAVQTKPRQTYLMALYSFS